MKVPTPESLGLEFHAEQILKYHRLMNLRLRGSADEFCIGSIVVFTFLLLFARTPDFQLGSVLTVSFGAMCYFAIEWYEVQRLKRARKPHEDRFLERGFQAFVVGERLELFPTQA